MSAWQRSVPETFYHVHVAMKENVALEQPSGKCVGHELASAAHSCTCYGKLTH